MARNGDFFPVRRTQDGDLSLSNEPGSFFNTSPWQLMRRMQEDMDRVFGQMLQPAIQQAQQWAPSVDVSQAGNEWLVEADLPGVSKDSIDVQVYNGHLILRAEMRKEEKPEGDERQYHRRERRYGYFERVIPLPQNVDDENVKCEFKDGVLKIHLPKLEQPKPLGRRVPISEGTTEQPVLEPKSRETSPANGTAKAGARKS